MGNKLAQGDLALLDTPLAKDLLVSRIPARLAYCWMDGTPRVVPIYHHWTGEEMVFGSFPHAPKVRALQANPMGAVTLDTEAFPSQVLLLRGSVDVSIREGVLPEYAAAMKRCLGEEAGTAFVASVDQPGVQMARLALRPTWVGTIDFDKRLPSALGGLVD